MLIGGQNMINGQNPKMEDSEGKQLSSSVVLKTMDEKEIVAWKKVIVNYLEYS